MKARLLQPPYSSIHLSNRVIRGLAIAGVLTASAFLGYHPSLPLVVIVCGMIGLGLLLQWPVLGLPGLVLAAAFVPYSMGSGINLAMLGVLGLTAVWLSRMLIDRRLQFMPSPANIPWVLLIAVSGLSIVAGAAQWSPWVTTKSNFLTVQLAQGAIFILSACAYWLLAHDAGGRRTLAILLTIVLGLGTVLIASGLIPPLRTIGDRMLMNGPILRIWVVALAAGLALFHTGLNRRVRFALFGLAGLMVGLQYWVSRDWQSGWLPPLMALTIICIIWIWDRSHWFTLTIIASTALTFVLYQFVLSDVVVTDRWSLDTRMIAWRGLAQLLQGRWLFGLGLASYWHYWRGELGSFSYLDPTTGALHYTFDAKVNMHNNYLDVLGQMGIIGVVVVVWLIAALFLHARRQLLAEPPGFGKAYAAAAMAGLGGMVFAGMLGDWIWPFVYNIGMRGFTDAFLGWMLLGGLVVLERTQPAGVLPPALPDA